MPLAAVHLRPLRMRSLLPALIASLALSVGGCVGTDFIADPPPVFEPRLEISPTMLALAQGDMAQLMATYFDMSGEAVPDATITWTISDPARATIDATGAVVAQTPGQAEITATTSGITSDPILLTVVADANQVASVIVAPDTVMIEPTSRTRFTAQAFNVAGDVLDGGAITWRSSDPAIATIDADGLATGVAPGVVDIIATIDGVASAPATLIVLGSNRTGTFQRSPGTSYRLAGMATLQERPDGTLELQFSDDFFSSSGPSLFVYLSTSNRVGSGSLQVAELQSTSGAQTYVLPTNITLDQYDWVIIHCVPFNVSFGYARLN